MIQPKRATLNKTETATFHELTLSPFLSFSNFNFTPPFDE